MEEDRRRLLFIFLRDTDVRTVEEAVVRVGGAMVDPDDQ